MKAIRRARLIVALVAITSLGGSTQASAAEDYSISHWYVVSGDPHPDEIVAGYSAADATGAFRLGLHAGSPQRVGDGTASLDGTVQYSRKVLLDPGRYTIRAVLSGIDVSVSSSGSYFADLDAFTTWYASDPTCVGSNSSTAPTQLGYSTNGVTTADVDGDAVFSSDVFMSKSCTVSVALIVYGWASRGPDTRGWAPWAPNQVPVVLAGESRFAISGKLDSLTVEPTA